MNQVSNAEREVKAALKSILRSLEEVRAQRAAWTGFSITGMARNRGEIWGLDVAITVIKRRLK